MADPFSVLGVSPSASKAEIKAAFRKKAMAHHPDMHSTAPEAVKNAHDAAFKSLNAAYQSLMDDTMRYRQRAQQAGRGGFARAGYQAGGASAQYNPFTSSYGAAAGSRYSGWRQYQRRGGFDFAGLFRSFAELGRAGAAATTMLGLLLAGGVLLMEPLAGLLWERNNEGKLFSSIEADHARRTQQQQQARRAAAMAAAAGRAAAPTAGAEAQPAAGSAAVPQAREEPLDGVRAVASLWVLLVHCWSLWWPLLGSYDTVRAMGNHKFWPWLATQGAFGADILVVLSALLATYHLLPALEGSGAAGEHCAVAEHGAVLAYWRRRARRILPGYAVTNLLALALFRPNGRTAVPPLAAAARDLVFPNCPGGLWANALFLTNSLPTVHTCGGHLWTVVLLVQFYAALPLILCALRPRRPGFRTRVAATLAAAVAGGTLWRFRSLSRTTFFLPIGDRTLPEEEANLAALMGAAYLPTASRLPELAAGAAAGLLLRSPAALGWTLNRPALVSGAAFALQAAYLSTVSFGNLFPAPGAPRLPKPAADLAATLAFYGGPLHALTAAATLLALLARSDPLHAAAARLLGSRPMRQLASLSYGLYLLHEMVKYGLVLAAPGLLPLLVARAPLAALAGLTAATLAGSLAASWLLLRLVERRFRP